MGIKIIPIWRDKKITWHPCHNIQSWLTSWNICCCRVMFVWQTVGDPVWYWQWTLKNYISNEHTNISAGDIGEIFWQWLLILKSDIIVTVPEGRGCWSVTVVEMLKWDTVLESEIVVELIPELAITVQFLKWEIVDTILKLSRVVEFLTAVCSKILLIKALLHRAAIVLAIDIS